MKKMPLISAEGLDGAGKGEAIKIIIEELERAGIPYVRTREPGGTPIAEKLRDFVKHTDFNEEMTIETETLLFYASRVQNVKNVIKPSIEKGYAVICDRFADSTLAYQSARGMDKEKIKAIHHAVLGDFKPDMTLYLDVDLQTSKSRMNYRGEQYDRIERAADLFFNKARENYLLLAKEDPKRFRVIDAKEELSVVSDNVRKVVRKFLVEFLLSQDKDVKNVKEIKKKPKRLGIN